MSDQQPLPPVDPGNPYLTKVPASLVTSELTGPDGRVAAATIRTPGTTLTVLLTRDECAQWAAAFQNQANSMSGLVVAPAGAMLLDAAGVAR
jgi:hypothetical protein